MSTAFWITDGLTSVIRGATQIITTPLTRFVKMPIRGIITAIKGVPKIEENPGSQKLMKNNPSSIAHYINAGLGYRSGGIALTQKALHAKFKCSQSKGQHTNIDPSEEEYRYDNGLTSGCVEYFKLFSFTNKKPTVMDKENAPLISTKKL